MNQETIRALCLSWPGVTESLQWGEHMVLKTGGKIFAVVNLEAAGNAMSLKVPAAEFAELCEREGILPAPYLARASWVALETFDAMPAKELRARLRQSYDMVVAKLPRKVVAAF